jgi:RNA polymerase sigma-70 factor, ECF subfamily
MTKTPPTDAELVARTLAGEREAFGQLYDRYARIVAAVSAGVSGDWPAVDDMVQECFLRAYRNLARLREPASFGAWVTGTARQVGRERRRTLRRDRHKYLEASAMETEASPAAKIDFQTREQIHLVMQRVAMLGEQERVAIHAHFLDQQNARQTAQLLGMSRSGFYALLQRAIARLATKSGSREGEAPAEPAASSELAQQELRPLKNEDKVRK